MKKLLFVTSALVSVSTIASADETLKWRHVQHATEIHAIEVSDAKGHSVNVLHAVGVASFPDGSVGSTSAFGLNDTINGSGPIQGYFFLTTADGSELRLKYAGTISAGKVQGTDTIVGGTGKFANANGEGTFTGSSIRTSGIGMNYIDNVLNIKTGDQAAEAKAMLEKTVAAIKQDRDVAIGQINKGEGGFRVGDTYPFCTRVSDGKGVAGPVYVPAGTDTRTLKDGNGKAYGQEIYDVGKKTEGQITEITYTAPKPGTKTPEYPKVSFVTRIGDLVCGVGYYK